jgi:hypothetical protein
MIWKLAIPVGRPAISYGTTGTCCQQAMKWGLVMTIDEPTILGGTTVLGVIFQRGCGMVETAIDRMIVLAEIIILVGTTILGTIAWKDYGLGADLQRGCPEL